MYEIGSPMIDKMSYNYVQAELNLGEKKYFEALKSSGGFLFNTIREGIWLGMSALGVAAMYGIAHGIYARDLKSAAAGAGAIVLTELIKDVMNNPQRYCIVRPSRNAGTTNV